MKLWPAPLVMLALAGSAGAAEPLEDAAYEATRLCMAVEADSLEACGGSSARSAEHSAARKALIRMYGARMAFMQTCEQRDSLRDCQHMAEAKMSAGTNRAGSDYWKARGFK